MSLSPNDIMPSLHSATTVSQPDGSPSGQSGRRRNRSESNAVEPIVFRHRKTEAGFGLWFIATAIACLVG